jgi:hypothetical protein
VQTENQASTINDKPQTATSDSLPTSSTNYDPALQVIVQEHVNQRRSGARWFYWIGALSLVNAVITMANGEWNFIIGLGITQIISGLALGLSADLGSGVTIIAFALNVLVVGACVGLGFLAERGHTWAFILGMVLYALDGLIFLWVQDWLPLGFHAFALYFIYRGLAANLKLNQFKSEGVAIA